MAQDVTYVSANYYAQGGGLWYVGAELQIGPSGKITANGVQPAAPDTSGVADAPTKAVLDSIVSALKGVGVMH